MRNGQLTYRTASHGRRPLRRIAKRYAFPVFTGSVAVAAGIVLGSLGR